MMLRLIVMLVIGWIVLPTSSINAEQDNYSLPKQYNKFSKFAFSFVSEGQIKSGSTTIALWRQGQSPTKWQGIIFLDGNKCQMSLKFDLRIRCQNGMDFLDDTTNAEYVIYGKGNRDLKGLNFYGRDYKNHRFDFKFAGIGTASKHDFIKSIPTTLPVESNFKNKMLCSLATVKIGGVAFWGDRADYVKKAKLRGLNCDVAQKSISNSPATETASATKTKQNFTSGASDATDVSMKSLQPCPTPGSGKDFFDNCYGERYYAYNNHYIGEWKNNKPHGQGSYFWSAEGYQYDSGFTDYKFTLTSYGYAVYRGEFKHGKRDGFGSLTFADGRPPKTGVWHSGKLVAAKTFSAQNDNQICELARFSHKGKKFWYGKDSKYSAYVQEAKRRGLSCGVGDSSTTQISSSSSATQPNAPTSAELTAAKKEAERLRQELAALKAQQEQQQQTISNDTQIPLITIASANTKGKQGVIRGRVSDNVGVAEITASGQPIPFDASGNFQYQTFVPAGGKDIVIEVTDVAGLTSKQTVLLTRAAGTATAAITFDSLNPLGRRVAKNKDAIALIIGIAKYKNTENSAYADKDALVFRDYATEKLGIPDNQITTLINEDAEIGEVLLSIRKWVRRSTKPDKTEVYVFFAGHGLATATGEAYILPYDGRPEVDLLDRTALLQKELFAEIDKANPRNVTIFLDACYTGKARTGEVLMADANYRPIAIRPIDDGMPDNFTLITASSGDEFSGPLEEAKHGLFSYFLMKGMEGDADRNQDNKITSGELHAYVKENVLRQSSGSQTPELQGDADRVLVRFQ